MEVAGQITALKTANTGEYRESQLMQGADAASWSHYQ